MEEGWIELGREIYDKEESIQSKMEELQGLMKIFRKEGVKMGYRTLVDGNCFYHTVGEQVDMPAAEIRKIAVDYLRENEWINWEEWSCFVLGRERGKRAYSRAMATNGEWADHVTILATAKALRKRISVFSQTEKTVVGGEQEGEILLGYIGEQHYFGGKKAAVEKEMEKETGTTQETKE